MKFICHYCKKESDKELNEINRAKKVGLNLYCSRKCSGLGRRKHKTKAQLKEAKRLYDKEYRQKNIERIKAEKKAYFKATYDPLEAAIVRKKRMPKHVEYCRRPEYKKWKQGYDRQYRANKFGEYAEAYLTLRQLEILIHETTTKYDTKLENQTLNKALKRRRQDQ